MRDFDQLIEAVKQQIRPEKRAQHLAEMLQQLFMVIPDDANLADLVTGWQFLGRPQSQDESAAVAHRRMVYADLSTLAAQFISEPGDLAGAVKTWKSWQDAWQRSAVPHQAAMTKTLSCELAELQSAQG
jgi:hypothetical protein